MHRSIGSRLTIWYTGLLTVTFLILGGIAYGLLTYSLASDLDAALNGVAEVVVKKTLAGDQPFYQSDVDDLFRRFFGFSPMDRYFELFDALGHRDPRQVPRSRDLPPSNRALENAARGVATFETVETTAIYPVRLLTLPVVRSGRVVNMVRVGMSLENTIKTRKRFLLIMGAVLPLGLLFAGGGGWLLARRALRPVDRMTRTAQRISGENLNERLQLSGSGDELDRLAATLNAMLGRLNVAIDQMRQFSADASHELQTPLTILKGEMEVALRAEREPVEYQRVLSSSLEEIDRINHLVESLLLLARADAGVMRLDNQLVDLMRLLREINALMNVVAEVNDIELRLKPSDPVTINGDRAHLRRLILNLVDNAIKYTPAGGRVTLSLHSQGDWVRLGVTDTGVGLSESERRLVFDRFHRSTDTRGRDIQGGGLGLNIARSIAEAHGGRITVESTLGQGSVFTVRLPLLQTIESSNAAVM